MAVKLDVTQDSQAREAAKAAIERFGRIDILVNNAGFGLPGAVEEATAEQVEAVYRTNVFGLLAVTRAVLPHMRRQRSGRVLNLSSVGGLRGAAGWGIHCSTKFAVEGLSETLAQELAPLGIHVTAIEPGYFRTDFLDPTSLVTDDAPIDDYHQTSGAMRSFAPGVSHKQPGDPAKLAKVLVSFVDTENPPVHLPLGSDTVTVLEGKIAELTGLVQTWRATSVSTDFGAAVASN